MLRKKKIKITQQPRGKQLAAQYAPEEKSAHSKPRS